jgi:hypothetical protein
MRQVQAVLRPRHHAMQRMGRIHSTCPNEPTNLHREMQEKARIKGENDL